MAARQLSWPPTILFYRCRLDIFFFLFFRRLSPRSLGRSSPNFTTCSLVTRFIKFDQKFGWPHLSEIWRPKTSKFRLDFAQLCDLIVNIATRHRKSQNGLANYGHSRTGKLNLVYFGPQTAKIRTGVLTYSTGGHQAGHCHAPSCICIANVSCGTRCVPFLVSHNNLSKAENVSSHFTRVTSIANCFFFYSNDRRLIGMSRSINFF